MYHALALIDRPGSAPALFPVSRYRVIYYNIRPLIGDKRLETNITRFVFRDLFRIFRTDGLFGSNSEHCSVFPRSHSEGLCRHR
jgi:hypothetical protein